MAFCTLPKIIRIKSLATIGQKILAWSVHVFTATGAVAAFLAIIAIDQEDWARCFLWLFVCLVIDGVDGTFARLANAKETLPNVDGKHIDFVVDFVTYVIIPVFFFYKAGMTSDHLMLPCAAMMLLSSSVYYGITNMTDNDEYFIGFPALWNVIVFFQFFIVHTGSVSNFWIVVLFSILHFVPLRYAYPSRAKKYFWAHLIIAIIGLAAGLYILLTYPSRNQLLEWITLVGALYFAGMAIIESLQKLSKK
ncbi:MAG: hypothetical protein KJP00_05700 [Bacteroidia bacterium]|nr:hypothetical protein [Bacteroidia bacterium]